MTFASYDDENDDDGVDVEKIDSLSPFMENPCAGVRLGVTKFQDSLPGGPA